MGIPLISIYLLTKRTKEAQIESGKVSYVECHKERKRNQCGLWKKNVIDENNVNMILPSVAKL